MTGGIKAWPEDERPREKMMRRGSPTLSDAELLALIIRTGDSVSKRSAIDLGRALLQEFGDLRTLAGATVGELCAMKGTGPAKAASIKAGDHGAHQLGAAHDLQRTVHLSRAGLQPLPPRIPGSA